MARRRAASGWSGANTSSVTANRASGLDRAARPAPVRDVPLPQVIATGTITRVDAACEANTLRQVSRNAPPSSAATAERGARGDHERHPRARRAPAGGSRRATRAAAGVAAPRFSTRPATTASAALARPKQQRDVERAAAGEVRGADSTTTMPAARAGHHARGASARRLDRDAGGRPPGGDLSLLRGRSGPPGCPRRRWRPARRAQQSAPTYGGRPEPVMRPLSVMWRRECARLGAPYPWQPRCHGYIAHHAGLRTDRPVLPRHGILSRPARVHRVRRRRLVGGAAARPADAAPDAPAAGPGAGRRGAARGDARPARPRPLGPAGRPARLLDDGVRPAGGRAARPPRSSAGRRRRHLAGRQRLARGRRPRARAGARADRRDAGPQQRGRGRDPGLRAADVRRPVPALHGQRRPAAHPAGPAWRWCRSGSGIGLDTCDQRADSVAAVVHGHLLRPGRPVVARAARDPRRRRWSWGIPPTRSTRPRTPRCSPRRCPTPRSCGRAASSSGGRVRSG